MTKAKPKVGVAEFKESAVKLAIESKCPIAKLTKELGITKTSLYNWVALRALRNNRVYKDQIVVLF